MKPLKLSACVLCLGLLGHSASLAVTLTEAVAPATFADTALSGTSLLARPELAGTVVADITSTFSFQGVSGTVQSRVLRETATGTLDFYWKIDVLSSVSGAGISAFRLTDFGHPFLQDADWRSDTPGTVGVATARLFRADTDPTGAINFLFGGGIVPGASSHLFFLRTTAMDHALSASFDVLTTGNQQLSGLFSTFAPAVPEPSRAALSLLGLALWGVQRWRVKPVKWAHELQRPARARPATQRLFAVRGVGP